MKQIEISCKQTVTYSQHIEVTDEEYEILKASDGDDIYQLHDPEVYNIIDSKLNYHDIFESDDAFIDFSIIEP
jgi:hypothetical protein